MEVRFGEAQASWLELGRPALKSLRSMAQEVGHDALVAAVDGFVGALQTVARAGTAHGGDRPVARDAAGGVRAACVLLAARVRAGRRARSPRADRRPRVAGTGRRLGAVDDRQADGGRAGHAGAAVCRAGRRDRRRDRHPRRDRRRGGRAHSSVPSFDAGRAGDRRSDGDDPRARQDCRAAARRARGVRGSGARLDAERPRSEEAAPAAAPDDVPAGHDRARRAWARSTPPCGCRSCRSRGASTSWIGSSRPAPPPSAYNPPPPPPPRPTAAPAPTRARTPPMWTPASTAAPIRWRPETAIQQKEPATHG